ncbi:MAGUK p55 sub member 7 [Desmophyllum pertusum]|uniref:MAGUK p55 sub member 7 n=1 Tax=Desmophyllum pertusum TaxID=174260 RepID=A0A9W9YUE2_9CNID|nr:MAGUK p55 sub member 7 [Desmophyllum pertusum]
MIRFYSMSNVTNTKQGDPSFQRLLTCLEQIRHKLDSREDDFQFLGNYFHSKDFWKLVKVHSTISYSDNGKSEAVHGNAVDIAGQVAETLLPQTGLNKEIQELQHILRKPHFKGLLQAHDLIAAGDFTSIVPEDEETSDQLLEEKPEKCNSGDNIPVENYKAEENDDVNINDRMGADVKTTPPAADSYSTDDDGRGIDYEETEDLDEADGNKEKDNLDKNTFVTFADMGNDNAEVLSSWDLPVTPNNMESAFQLPVTDHSISKRQGGEDANDMSNANNDIKEEHGMGGHKVDGTAAVKVVDNAVRTVRMFRNAKETLGITVKAVRSEGNAERIVVARILRGGLADTFAALYLDDEILEINGKRVEGLTANEVADMMDGVTGSVDIKVFPAKKDRKLTRETKICLRACFDYNPLQDPLIPCKEVGVAFSTGDVLHVVNMDDANWWQARKDGCNHDKAGLIPSKDFQEKRQHFNRISSSNDVTLQNDKNGRQASPFKRMIRKTTDSNKVFCNFLQDIQMDGWPAYEPVAKYLERPEKKRLLLLIGAPGVGRNEIKKLLLSNSPDKFITTVPHTSRRMKSYEADSKDYFFVSRQTMENFIQKRKLIEFGEYKGCLYGTSIDSIKRALKSGKTCVLKIQPEVMLMLRTTEFKPYCVYIKPPPLKELRTSRLTVQAKSKPASDKSLMRTFKEEDLQEMISASRMLEDTYGRFFDLTVVNKEIDEAHVSVTEAFERLEQEEHWVPLDWAQKN